MTVAQQIGRRLIQGAGTQLDHEDAQSWAALCVMDSLSDRGESVLRLDFKDEHLWQVFNRRCAKWLPDLEIRPAVRAWVTMHSRGRLKWSVLWAAMISAVSVDHHTKEITMELLAAVFINGFPSANDMADAWTRQETLIGPELDFERSWS